MDLQNGTATVTLTWANGAPDTTSFEVLWSKVSNEGNWMLRAEDLPVINTAANCSGTDTGGSGTGTDTGGSGTDTGTGGSGSDTGTGGSGTDTGTGGSGTAPDPSLELLIIDHGLVTSDWGGTDKFSAFDEKSGYGDCTDEANGTETCASIDWEVVTTAEKGDVLQVSYASDAGHAGIVVGPIDGSWDVSSASSLDFDIKVVNSGSASVFKYKLESDGANSGEIAVAIAGSGDWESISIPASEFNATAFDPATG
jgi:hypothetical protein